MKKKSKKAERKATKWNGAERNDGTERNVKQKKVEKKTMTSNDIFK